MVQKIDEVSAGVEIIDGKKVHVTNFRVTHDPPESDPNFGETGESFGYDSIGKAKWAELVPAITEVLHIRARQELPKGSVYEIREKIPTNYGRGRGLAWYHIAAMKDWPVTGKMPAIHNPAGGYIYHGTFRTP